MQKWKRLSWLAGLLLLSLPLTMPYLFGLYRTAVVIPRFESRQARILAALASHRAERGSLPESLSELVPAYLPGDALKFHDWPFTFHPDEAGAFVLHSDVPSRWSNRPAASICRAGPGEAASCTYHYVCGAKTATYLTGPVPDPDFGSVILPFWQREDPCDG